MIFRIVRASNIRDDAPCPVEGAVKEGGDWRIQVDSLEELMSLQNRCGSDLILSAEALWIYDDYME